ncbi:MAG: signal peptide peptidase SppA [Firmicutes bacterium]|nr:signal peptide peptidase SppA [Bacillota bacterium]
MEETENRVHNEEVAEQAGEQTTEQGGEQVVQYYSGGNFSDSPSAAAKGAKIKKPLPGWTKAIIIIAIVIGGLVLIWAGLKEGVSNFAQEFTSGFTGSSSTSEVTTNFGHDYIGTVNVVGEMSEDGSGTYNHRYILNAIDAMIEDEENKGMILFVDTPGGTVFSADELYFKIKEYQEKTGRPVYSSMQSMAASGGYYISAPCDKIFANRNCWTGSIGVTMGTFIDVSRLLDNLGIRTETITSGENKSMGSSYEPLTTEQKAIFQSLIDEAYDQFVEIVADGRKMDERAVRKLADGRIYTAKQAMEAGLVDQIGTYEEAVEDMRTSYELGEIAVEKFYTTEGTDILSLLSGMSAKETTPDADLIEELLELDGKFEVSYMSEIRK